MQRTVIRMARRASDATHATMWLEQAQCDFPNSFDLYDLPCTPNDPPFVTLRDGPAAPNYVQAAGQHLFRGLTTHPAIAAAVNQFMITPPDRTAPLFFQIDTDLAEALPWEALWADNDFVALLGGRAVGRISGSTTSLGRVIERAVEPPLRFLAVLSASGVAAGPEWDAIWAAINRDDFLQHIPIFLYVMVSEDDLFETVKGKIGESQKIDVKVEYVTDDLLSKIDSFNPNILHFFCHGDTTGGAHLKVAQRKDQLMGLGSGMAVNVSELQTLFTLDNNTWLVFLNCCKGAAYVNDTYSLARALVASGFPAVVGMRETIENTTAHAFCRIFYNRAFNFLSEMIRNDLRSQSIEWVNALFDSRRSILQSYNNNLPYTEIAPDYKEWTLPVIYVRPETFMLRPPAKAVPTLNSNHQERQTEFDVLVTSRETLSKIRAIPPQLLESIDARIAALAQELYGQ